MPFPTPDTPIPELTTPQMIEVDRLMIDEYGVTLPRMMENAGRALAEVARRRFLDGDPRGRRVIALAGPGGNGGGALVAARRLSGWGADVAVAISEPDEVFTETPRRQLQIVRRIGLPVAAPGDAPAGPGDLILDGLIGYSLRGAPAGVAADHIRWANAQAAPVLALDAPSGVDASGGVVFDPAICAAATVTLALPKAGLFAQAAEPHVGELYLADISVPPSLYAEPSIGVAVGPIFAQSDIVKLT